jgi:hypothetical protein
MRVLVLDVWLDLRRKRLWPVALVLVAALVAAPIVLLGGEEPPEVPPAPARAGAESGVTVRAAGAEAAASELEAFSAADPFRRPAARKRRAARRSRPAARPSADAEPATPRSADPEPATRPSADPEPADEPPPAPAAPAPAEPDPSPSPSPDPDPPAGDTEPESRLLTDVVDVTFGRRGAERARRAVARLEHLPPSGEPVATFLGTTPSGRSAVFLLRDGLTVAGDGRCEPRPSTCSFLTLRPDRRHDQAFLRDADGRKWSLRLDELERVPVEEAGDEPRATGARTRDRDAPALGATLEERRRE